MPLAIELAAGRCAALHPAEIVARLEDRLKLLTGGRRTAAARHRTLAATIDWSYDLLDEPQRVLFRRLGVFTGSFPRRRPDGRFGWRARRGRPAREPGGQVDGRRGRVPLPVVGDASGVRRPPSRRGRRTGRGGGRRGGALCGLGRRRGHWAEGAGRTGLGRLLADGARQPAGLLAEVLAAGDLDTALGCFAPLPEWDGLALHVTQELATWAEPTVRVGGAAEHPLYVGACLLASRGRYNAWDRAGAGSGSTVPRPSGPSPPVRRRVLRPPCPTRPPRRRSPRRSVQTARRGHPLTWPSTLTVGLRRGQWTCSSCRPSAPPTRQPSTRMRSPPPGPQAAHTC